LCRDNLRLKGEKLSDLKRITKVTKENSTLRSTCTGQKAALEDLSRELQQQRSVRNHRWC